MNARCKRTETTQAWLAMIAALIINMLLVMADSFGVIYDELVDRFDSNRANVGWILSIRWIFIFVSSKYIIIG